MSRTRKDSSQSRTQRTVLNVTRIGHGAYDVCYNGKLVASNISERWFNEELCAKYGFCGAEYLAILQELNENGKAGTERERESNALLLKIR